MEGEDKEGRGDRDKLGEEIKREKRKKRREGKKRE